MYQVSKQTFNSTFDVVIINKKNITHFDSYKLPIVASVLAASVLAKKQLCFPLLKHLGKKSLHYKKP